MVMIIIHMYIEVQEDIERVSVSDVESFIKSL
jgi:hypothetical protein